VIAGARKIASKFIETSVIIARTESHKYVYKSVHSVMSSNLSRA